MRTPFILVSITLALYDRNNTIAKYTNINLIENVQTGHHTKVQHVILIHHNIYTFFDHIYKYS